MRSSPLLYLKLISIIFIVTIYFGICPLLRMLDLLFHLHFLICLLVLGLYFNIQLEWDDYYDCLERVRQAKKQWLNEEISDDDFLSIIYELD